MKSNFMKLIMLAMIIPLAGCGNSSSTTTSGSLTSATTGTSSSGTSTTSTPSPEDKGLIGNKLIYNGHFDSFEFEEDTNPEEFLEALENFYPNGGATEFRIDLAKTLTSYCTEGGGIAYTPDGYTWFGDESTKQERTYKEKTISTYKVNNVDGNMLCEYGLDPDSDSVYHFYIYDDGELFHYPIISTEILGNPLHFEVLDQGLVYHDNQLKILFDVRFTYNDEEQKINLGAQCAFYLGNGKSSDVEVIKQPTDIHVNYPSNPDELVMSFEVNHPEKVKSYQWYIGTYVHGLAVSFSQIKGEFSKSNEIHLRSIGCAMSRIPLKCLIICENQEFFSGIGDIYVDNVNEFVPVAYLLDYPIMAGETLDLSTTPYGTGKISYDKNETDFTFENVQFNNANIESDIQSGGFMIESWANKYETYNFHFAGKNVWNCVYWEEENHQGGLGFYIHFAGKSVLPVINFVGDGDITFIGSTRAIAAYGAYAHINCTMNFIGLPNRLTCGVFADNIVVEEGAIINAVIGGSLLSTNFTDNYNSGFLDIKKGARINAIINAGNTSVGEVALFGIRASRAINIESAYVNIIIEINYEYFFNVKQMLLPVQALYCNSGTVDIKNSEVYIKILTAKTPKEDIENIAESVGGIGGMSIGIKNSLIDVSIDSSAFCNVSGINTGCLEVESSYIDVYVRGHEQVSGIVSTYRKDRSVSGALVVKNSKVNVVSEADCYNLDETGKVYYVDAGIRAVYFEFDLDDDSFVHIKTNRASVIVSIFDHVKTKVEPVKDYVPTQILLDDLSVYSDEYEINCNSYSSYSSTEEPHNFFVKYESMYVNKGEPYSQFLTEITLTKKSI